MDWDHQLLATAIWLGEAFVASILGMAVIAALIGRFTHWGRQFLRLTWAYFSPARSKRPVIWVTAIILMTLFAVRMEVLFSFWYNGFYTAMQKLDATAFWFMLVVFAVLATVHVGRALVNFYLRQSFLIHWRIWLTDHLIDQWLKGRAYYRSQFAPNTIDNPDQRIQQDIASFVESSVTLSMGLLNSVVSLFAFTIILWGLSGPLTLFGTELPRAMVFLVYLYVIIATVFALRIGRPLIRLNFLNEQLGANFRYALVRLREYGESVAFYQGESIERGNLMNRFRVLIANVWAIVYRSLKFQGFNLAISQAAVVFPFIVQAPRLLSKQITLGDVMQTSQSFGQVESALSFLRTSYDDFAGYRAVINRLSGFLDSIDYVDQLPSAHIESSPHQLTLTDLSVRTPAGLALVKNLSLSLSRPASLLIRGPSGVGKTTLLRAIAGLWPYVEGTVARPCNLQSLFLPQKPYLPLGPLREALFYPAAAERGDKAVSVLNRCHLSHLIERLDDDEDWTSILSLGEQQRLAIGRVLLNQPEIVFLDEASSAMDEGLEQAMYRLLREALPDTILVSVGHRSSLLAFHTSELVLAGEGRWQLDALPRSAFAAN